MQPRNWRAPVFVCVSKEVFLSFFVIGEAVGQEGGRVGEAEVEGGGGEEGRSAAQPGINQHRHG